GRNRKPESRGQKSVHPPDDHRGDLQGGAVRDELKIAQREGSENPSKEEQSETVAEVEADPCAPDRRHRRQTKAGLHHGLARFLVRGCQRPRIAHVAEHEYGMAHAENDEDRGGKDEQELGDSHGGRSHGARFRTSLARTSRRTWAASWNPAPGHRTEETRPV